MDLIYAVKYKKENIIKSMTTLTIKLIELVIPTLTIYLFLHSNPRIYVWQLDFLGSIKTDSKKYFIINSS